jgi:hypothetical protein
MILPPPSNFAVEGKKQTFAGRRDDWCRTSSSSWDWRISSRMSRSLSFARTRRPTSLPPHKKWAPQQLLLLPSEEVMLKWGTRRTRKVGRRCGQLRRPDTLAGGSYGPEDVGVREGEGVGRPWPLRLEHAVSELPRPIVAGSSPSPWTAKNSARSSLRRQGKTRGGWGVFLPRQPDGYWRVFSGLTGPKPAYRTGHKCFDVFWGVLTEPENYTSKPAQTRDKTLAPNWA